VYNIYDSGCDDDYVNWRARRQAGRTMSPRQSHTEGRTGRNTVSPVVTHRMGVGCIKCVTALHTYTHPFNGPLSNLDFIEAKDSEWQWHQLGQK